jgi:hypothetical protein
MLTSKVGVGAPCYGFDDRTTGWKALNATICISMKGGCACSSLLAIIYRKSILHFLFMSYGLYVMPVE